MTLSTSQAQTENKSQTRQQCYQTLFDNELSKSCTKCLPKHIKRAIYNNPTTLSLALKEKVTALIQF